MKRLVWLIWLAVLAACGSLEEGTPPTLEPQAKAITPVDPGNPPPPPPPSDIPCCDSSVVFFLQDGVRIPASGQTNVSVYTSLEAGFYTSQDPSRIRITVSPAVNCTWVWSDYNRKATCTPQGRMPGLPGLAYGTQYTLTVSRYVALRKLGYWSTWASGSFTTYSNLQIKRAG